MTEISNCSHTIIYPSGKIDVFRIENVDYVTENRIRDVLVDYPGVKLPTKTFDFVHYVPVSEILHLIPGASMVPNSVDTKIAEQTFMNKTKKMGWNFKVKHVEFINFEFIASELSPTSPLLFVHAGSVKFIFMHKNIVDKIFCCANLIHKIPKHRVLNNSYKNGALILEIKQSFDIWIEYLKVVKQHKWTSKITVHVYEPDI